MKKDNQWARLLAYVTGLVNQELLLQNEYLAAENRILRSRLPSRLRLSDPERSTLAEIGKRLGRKALAQVAGVAQPDTILAWYRRLIAQKFDGSKFRSYPGPRISKETEDLIVQMAKENSGWGYDRIVGALANLGHVVSDQTVGNILRRHGIAPAPKRSQSTTWKDFIAAHMALLAGIDFFTVEVLTGGDWPRTMSSSSFTLRAGASASQESPSTRVKHGWNKSLAMRPMKLRDTAVNIATFCTTEIRNSVRRSDPYCKPAASRH